MKEYKYKVAVVIENLNEIGLKAAEKELVETTFKVLSSLEKIGLKCAEKKLDGISPKEFGFYVGEQFFSPTEQVLEALREIGVKAAVGQN